MKQLFRFQAVYKDNTVDFIEATSWTKAVKKIDDFKQCVAIIAWPN